MKYKRKLKQKFIEKNALFLESNVLNFYFNTKYRNREWGRKQVKWESWKLKSNKVVELNPDDIGDFVFPETKEC